MKQTQSDYVVNINGVSHQVTFDLEHETVRIGDEEFKLDAVHESFPNHFSFLLNGKGVRATIAQLENQSEYAIQIGGSEYEAEVTSARESFLKSYISAASGIKNEGVIKAPMPGLIVKIEVAVGDRVEAGDGVLIMEAMKMENEIKAPVSGVIVSIDVQAGGAVEKNQRLLVIE